jgi:PDZ domain
VNGKDIHSLDDLAEAVKQPLDGFDRIETEEDPKVIPLDVAQAQNDEPTLRENYGIPALQRLK